MEVLIAYDVSTESRAGRRRLRRVAKACLNFGQRVQLSVFECSLTNAQYEALIDEVTGEIDETEDCLRIYRIAQPREENVRIWGRDDRIDPRQPMII